MRRAGSCSTEKTPEGLEIKAVCVANLDKGGGARDSSGGSPVGVSMPGLGTPGGAVKPVKPGVLAGVDIMTDLAVLGACVDSVPGRSSSVRVVDPETFWSLDCIDNLSRSSSASSSPSFL